jgi:hypothetical protein
MKVEKGIDINGNDIWFVLDEADLVATFYSENEANDYILNI